MNNEEPRHSQLYNTRDGEDSSSTKQNKKKTNFDSNRIRVGRDYQATCPEYVQEHLKTIETLQDPAILLWRDNPSIDEDQLHEYTTTAKKYYNYSLEQAYGMLFWHSYNIERSMQDLQYFTPVRDDWTDKEKHDFEKAIRVYGKKFYNFRRLLPEKNISQCVMYYYMRKKQKLP